MNNLHQKIHTLIDDTTDPVVLENIHQYLLAAVSGKKKMLREELSDAELSSLQEARAEYRSGKTKSHEEVLEFLKKWREK